MHIFPYEWNIKDGYPSKNIEKHGLKVFSTFSCGGGSTMGYKLAGFDVIAANDIDPRMKEVYLLNHTPKHYFLCPVKDLINKELPKELYDIDILDGSPPCSVFSEAGRKEENWGKKKVFREGQASQILDDLFFDFIDLAEKLKPKVVIAENVKGMLIGNAKGYIKLINKKFNAKGYDIQIFLLNGASMGLPQKRERLFFIAKRKDLNFPKINLNFNEEKILVSEILEKNATPLYNLTPKTKKLLKYKKYGDRDLAEINQRVFKKYSYYSHVLIYPKQVFPTLTAQGHLFTYFNLERTPSKLELQRVSSFPLDYNFGREKPDYVMGMSVPPVMMAQVSRQVYLQFFKNLNK